MSESVAVRYRVLPVHPEAHLFQVELWIDEPDPQGQRLRLPAWIPGSYMIRDFARHLLVLEAASDGRPLALEPLDKQTWRAPPVAGGLYVGYRVYAWDLSVRGAHLDTTHGYFNGPALLLEAVGLGARPCELRLDPPAGLEWRVATTLEPVATDGAGFGSYRAADYAELIDHPVELGRFDEIAFEVAGVPHRIALSGRHHGDGERLARDLAAICQSQMELFQDSPPIDRYLFQLMVVGDGYGGLEHRCSTSLICGRGDLPRAGLEAPDEGYRRLLGLCSHEYFHLWHVKRIRPEALRAATLEREAYTRLLWLFEGFTAYYDDLMLVRAKVIEPDAYLGLLAQNITRLQRSSGRLKQSLEESSFFAWTKFYKQDENAPNAIVSYYLKGSLVALLLDLHLRLHSGGRLCLDDLMRMLWRRYGRTDEGVPEGAVEPLLAELSGLDFGPLLDGWLRRAEELPLAAYLAHAGIRMSLRGARDDKDQGGFVTAAAETASPRTVLGARLQEGQGALQISHVFDGGAAQAAGLAAGDTLVAVDGLRVSSGNLAGLLAAIPDGGTVEVHAFRRDELMRFVLTPLTAPSDTCDLALDPAATAAANHLREAWLGA